MNANEVVANRALELLGHEKGEYEFLHPNEDVNLGQSTNDVYPTAVKVATVFAVRGLLKAMAVLQDAFARKAVEFRDVLKMGRTQLQDAVPMTLGQEFSAYAVMIDEDRSRLAEAVELIHEINLGATAIGTGLNAPAGYAESARRHLAEITGLPLVTAANLVEATQDCGAFVQMSGVLKRIAVKLSKICNDLRLLSSGPRAGLGEINLPPVQAGSSIMPGKVNPVIPEVVNQVAFEVIGNDVTVTMAAEAGQLQLNAFEPIILHSLSESITHLRAACLTLAERCVDGITANTEALRATRGELHRPGHRPQPVHRLHGRHRHRQGGPRHRPGRGRTRPGEGPVARRDPRRPAPPRGRGGQRPGPGLTAPAPARRSGPPRASPAPPQRYVRESPFTGKDRRTTHEERI